MKKELAEETIQNHPNEQEKTWKTRVREATQSKCVEDKSSGWCSVLIIPALQEGSSSIPSSGTAKDVPRDVAKSTLTVSVKCQLPGKKDLLRQFPVTLVIMKATFTN